jgi:hypothetical protein
VEQHKATRERSQSPSGNVECLLVPIQAKESAGGRTCFQQGCRVSAATHRSVEKICPRLRAEYGQHLREHDRQMTGLGRGAGGDYGRFHNVLLSLAIIT